MKILKNVYKKVQLKSFNWFLSRKKKELHSTNFTLLSNNCTAGFVYHDLGLKFLTPTVDALFISIEDYLFFASEIKGIKESSKIVETKDSFWNCPCGLIKYKNKEIFVAFLHDSTFNIAKDKWERRMERINLDNLFVILDSYNQDLSSYQKYFSKIKNLLIFCNKNLIDKNAIYFNPGFYGKKYVDGKLFVFDRIVM